MNVYCSRNRLNAVTKLSRMNAGQKNSSLTLKKCQQRPQVAMTHKMRVFVMWH